MLRGGLDSCFRAGLGRLRPCRRRLGGIGAGEGPCRASGSADGLFELAVESSATPSAPEEARAKRHRASGRAIGPDRLGDRPDGSRRGADRAAVWRLLSSSTIPWASLAIRSGAAGGDGIVATTGRAPRRLAGLRHGSPAGPGVPGGGFPDVQRVSPSARRWWIGKPGGGPFSAAARPSPGRAPVVARAACSSSSCSTSPRLSPGAFPAVASWPTTGFGVAPFFPSRSTSRNILVLHPDPDRACLSGAVRSRSWRFVVIVGGHQDALGGHAAARRRAWGLIALSFDVAGWFRVGDSQARLRGRRA